MLNFVAVFLSVFISPGLNCLLCFFPSYAVHQHGNQFGVFRTCVGYLLMMLFVTLCRHNSFVSFENCDWCLPEIIVVCRWLMHAHEYEIMTVKDCHTGYSMETTFVKDCIFLLHLTCFSWQFLFSYTFSSILLCAVWTWGREQVLIIRTIFLRK